MRIELNYPEHKHPHGIENLPSDEFRIWICDECCHLFTDDELREDKSGEWGHPCKTPPNRKGLRCESHLEPYIPDVAKA